MLEDRFEWTGARYGFGHTYRMAPSVEQVHLAREIKRKESQTCERYYINYAQPS